jgi:hypothetical protein
VRCLRYVVAGAMLGAALSACGGGSGGTSGHDANVDVGTATHLVSHGTPYGFSVSMTVSFLDDRELKSGAFELAGKSYPAGFYPNDGSDDDSPPRILPVKAGITVITDAKVVPDCSGAAVPPVLVIRSDDNSGTAQADRFVANNADDYEAAVSQWCTASVQATVASSSVTPEGAVSVDIRLVNPGSDSVNVASDAYDVGGTHWNSASVDVPGSGSATLTITATNGRCRGPAPWTAGHLKSGDRVLQVSNGESWC